MSNLISERPPTVPCRNWRYRVKKFIEMLNELNIPNTTADIQAAMTQARFWVFKRAF